jgi:signal transduction histidine kinase
MIRLPECLESSLNDRRSRLTHIRVTKLFEPLPCVECNPAQIERAIGSILDNAIDAIDAKSEAQAAIAGTEYMGEIIITLNDHDDWIELSITDNGIGIPESARPRIFDPFFTTKDVGGGTGLGLTTAYQILVEGHGGRIDAETSMEHGTTIMVSLPVSQTKHPERQL